MRKKNKPDNIVRLKYRLEPKDNDLVEFQILEQDVKLFGNPHLIIGDKRFNGWEIISSNFPFVRCGHKELFIRGTSGFDLRTDVFRGHEHINSIHKALEEMIKHVFGHCKRIEE